ncbi:MAG: response regulator [Bacteriovoracaceae bacterium]
MKKAPTDKELADYLKDKSCLVVDTNSVSRTSVLKFLTSSGVHRDRIHMVDSIVEAIKELDSFKPDIVLTEYVVGRHSGIELLEKHLLIQPNRIDASFYILSQSNSMAIAAQVAELEIDGLITKPFTINGLKVTFINGLTHKVNPTKYVSKLENAKTLIREKQHDQAFNLLEECKKQTDEPSNAYFFEGTIFEELSKLVEAQNSFEAGLKTNPEHFRCMNHLFQIYISEKKFEEARSMGSKLFKLYPMSPSQIPNLTRMMIATDKFDEIYSIADKFTKEENIDPLMITYIAAAMAITAKHYQKIDQIDEALKVIARGSTLSNGSAKILRNMSQTCLAMNKVPEAEKLLKLVSEVDQTTDQYLAMDFEIVNATLPCPEIVKRGFDLVKKGHKDPAIFSILIKRATEDKRNEDLISDLRKQAKTLYPSLADQF